MQINVNIGVEYSVNSEHFSDAELQCHCGCGVNGCVQSLVDGLEAIRAIKGVPVRVNDAFRCAMHNAAVHGVPHSQHELGMAADIVIEGLSPAEMYKVALQVPVFANGGIGVMLAPTGYIHVDTRAGRARWCYTPQDVQCAWDPALDA